MRLLTYLMLIALSISMHLCYAQVTVRGVVTDEAGLPLSGVQVEVLGTQIVGSSDLDGKFQVQIVGKHRALRFQHVAYISYTKVIEETSVLQYVKLVPV
ncbi:MAG: carboxypeptidase-like regulatory domain-containing protein, partial [Sphingobacterium sp.]|nr:carboxypeptidase-like regulatory domain-containing protein [Sphingobacterium sp.]